MIENQAKTGPLWLVTTQGWRVRADRVIALGTAELPLQFGMRSSPQHEVRARVAGASEAESEYVLAQVETEEAAASVLSELVEQMSTRQGFGTMWVNQQGRVRMSWSTPPRDTPNPGDTDVQAG